MSKTKKIRVGISIGDVNGISPEIILKSFSNKQIYDLFTPVVFGSTKALSFYRKLFDMTIDFFTIKSLKDLREGRLNVIDLADSNIEIKVGENTEEAGIIALKSIETACQALIENDIDVLVTAPINKSNIKVEGFTGHTEFLEKKLGGESLMFMIHDKIKVGLVTQHVPIEKINEKISQKLIQQKIKKINLTLQRDFSIRKPKIAVLGLNPHAGDNGLLGKEEQEIIIPSIIKINQEKILAFGPFSADSFFTNENLLKYDAILAMYHDQGLIPFKTLTFGEGVNFTAGLNYIRTSPDHGVGYEIAGKNIANEQSFLTSIYTAIDLYNQRKINDELVKNSI
jgi:4-hydroxythreonine-4-phosphate dehydrogenase